MTAVATAGSEAPTAPPGPAWPRRTLHALVAVWAVVTATARLGAPDWLVDELLYSRVGRAYLTGDLTANREHPPLAKYLFGLGDLLVGGRLGPRLVAAAAGLVTCLALYLLARQVAGWRWGLVAALAWASLPHAVPTGSARFPVAQLERYAMLDVVATAFMTLALLAGWRWRASLDARLAALTGLAVGCATASKLVGATVGVVVVVSVLVAWPGRRALGQAAVAGAVAVAVYALAYLPFGRDALSAALEPVTLQLAHADAGHRVLVAGTVYDSAPWWSALWFGWRDDGPLLTVAVAVLAVLAVAVSRDRQLPLLLTGAAVAPFALLASSPVALPHYRYAWLPALHLLAVLGLRAALSRGTALRVVAGACGLVLLSSAGQQAVGLVDVEAGGYTRAACVAEAVDARSVVLRGYGTVLAAEAPALEQRTALPADLLLLDPALTSRFPADAEVASVVGAGWTSLEVGGLTAWFPAQDLAAARACAGS